MELMEAIKSRRSIRSYQSRPVEDEKLLAVLDAGRRAPSAKNMRGLAVHSRERPERPPEARHRS